MGIRKHLNFKAASKTVKAAQKDVQRPQDEVAQKRQQKNGGKK
jgi:hypothetical protein